MQEIMATNTKDEHAEDAFVKFLDSPRNLVLLLAGGSGTGKTSFLQIKAIEFWELYKLDQTDWVCLYIDLAAYQTVLGTFGLLHGVGIPTQVF